MAVNQVLAKEAGYVRDLSRAFGGALLFNLPLLMTMEMWEFGSVSPPARIIAFIFLGVPLLCGLAHYAGFSARRGVVNNLLDTLAALMVGAVTALALLTVFAVIDGDTTVSELAGHVLLQAVPGAMGALIARRQLSDNPGSEGDEDQATYPGELFLMAAGALFLALNLAPTEEMILISFLTTPWHALGLLAFSLCMLHVVVYLAGFAGQEEHGQPIAAFLHFTLPGYAITLATCLFMLWTFGRADGQTLAGFVEAGVVLAFPGSLGAAAARLLV